MGKKNASANWTVNATTYLQPRTRVQYERQRRVLDALAVKRKHPELALTTVAKRVGTTVKTIRRYAPSVLEVRSGRIDIKRSDRIPRTLEFLTEKGPVAVTVRNSRDATRIAKHRNAVRQAIITFGYDTKRLNKFAGKSVRANGRVYIFITDYQTLERLARAGALNMLDLYASPGGLS
jgi:hypothetical protein